MGKKSKKSKRRARLEEQTASPKARRAEKEPLLTQKTWPRRKVSKRELQTPQVSRRSVCPVPRTPVAGNRSLPLRSSEWPNKELQAPLESRGVIHTVALVHAPETRALGSPLRSSSAMDSSTVELLATTRQKQVPGHWEKRSQSPVDVQMASSSPPAMASTTCKDVLASYHAIQAGHAWSEQVHKQLDGDMGKGQGTLGAPSGTRSGESCLSPSKMEEQEHQEVQEDRLQPQGPSPTQSRSRRLREGCARLWRSLKAWGRTYCCCLPPAVEQ